MSKYLLTSVLLVLLAVDKELEDLFEEDSELF
jgi:hypothetical protein